MSSHQENMLNVGDDNKDLHFMSLCDCCARPFSAIDPVVTDPVVTDSECAATRVQASMELFSRIRATKRRPAPFVSRYWMVSCARHTKSATGSARPLDHNAVRTDTAATQIQIISTILWVVGWSPVRVFSHSPAHRCYLLSTATIRTSRNRLVCLGWGRRPPADLVGGRTCSNNVL